MNRRRYLTELGSAAGLVVLAGCSQLGGDTEGNDGGSTQDTASGSDGENSAGDGGSGDAGGSGDTGGNESANTDEDTAATDEAVFGGNDSDEALETGQAPPEDTGTPFENTPTVPEEEGLETGHPPNTTSS